MNIDLTPLLANFSAAYIIIPVLAVASVFLVIVALILYVTLIIDLVSGDAEKGRSRFFGGHKMPEIFGPIDDRNQRFAQRYKREKNRSEYIEWKKSKGY